MPSSQKGFIVQLIVGGGENGKTIHLFVIRHHLVAVNVVEPVQKLLYDSFDLAQTEFDVDIGQKAGEVVLAEVENQIKRGPVFVIVRGWNRNNEFSIFFFLEKEAALSSKINFDMKMLQTKRGSPLVRQISIRFTTFSCFKSWRILISLSAVMGN